MCGINAILGPAHLELLERMNTRIAHRGPDGAGAWRGRGVGLGSTRLRVMDPQERGDMPMVSPCGRYAIVFNGEIYNFQDLRGTVADYPFRTRTDTEVLFALLQRRGAEALPLLEGMFAFAFWDGRERTLLLARDRLGVKPLFWAADGGSLLASSEIAGLLEIPGLSTGLDAQALRHYLSLLAVPAPRTIYPRVRRFPAAHYAVWREGEAPEFRRWWDLSFAKSGDGPEELAEQVRAALVAAVRKRLVADVPLGVFLSGGVDSTVVAALAAEGTAGTLRTFCLGFEGGADERAVAARTAGLLGAAHTGEALDAGPLGREIPAIVRHFAEPFAGGLPVWFLARSMRRHVTVALSGTGGDEMFGNYGRARHLRPGLGPIAGLRSVLRVHGWGALAGLLSPAGRHALRHGGPAGHLYHEKCSSLKEWRKPWLLAEPAPERTDAALDRIFWEKPGLELEDRLFWLDLSVQLSGEFLHGEDVMSMAHGLETRHPFLDHRLVELMASVPCALRSGDPDDPKRWMRRVFRAQLPEHVLGLPKSGFAMPYGRWLRGELKALGDAVLEPGRLRAQGVFRPEAVTEMWRAHQAGAERAYEVWPLLVFQLWWHQREGRDFPGAG